MDQDETYYSILHYNPNWMLLTFLKGTTRLPFGFYKPDQTYKSPNKMMEHFPLIICTDVVVPTLSQQKFLPSHLGCSHLELIYKKDDDENSCRNDIRGISSPFVSLHFCDVGNWHKNSLSYPSSSSSWTWLRSYVLKKWSVPLERNIYIFLSIYLYVWPKCILLCFEKWKP